MSGQYNEFYKTTEQAAQDPEGYMQRRLLREAKECIQFLSSANAQLEAEAQLLRIKAEAHDTIVGLVRLLYFNKQGGMVHDSRSWQIRDLLEALEKEEKRNHVKDSQSQNGKSAGNSTSGQAGRPPSTTGEGSGHSSGPIEGPECDPSNTPGVGSVGQFVGEAASGAVTQGGRGGGDGVVYTGGVAIVHEGGVTHIIGGGGDGGKFPPEKVLGHID